MPETTKTARKKMLPHVLTVVLWAFLVVNIALNLNIAIAVTQARGNGSLKVITFFQLALFLFSVLLCLFFYGVRNEGKAEKGIYRLALLTFLVSSASLSLQFFEDLIFLTEVLEVTAWIFFNGVFTLSMFRISVAFVLPVFGSRSQENDSGVQT